jgi:hypothetical protein
MGVVHAATLPRLDSRKKSRVADYADFLAAYGVLARPLDYVTYVGLYLNRHRALIQKSYTHTMGLAEFWNEDDMQEDWIDALSEDEWEAHDLRLDINGRRHFERQMRDRG